MRTQTFLTVAQAAARLGVSKALIYKLIGAGRIRATLFGNLFAIAEEALEPVLVRPKPGRPRLRPLKPATKGGQR